MPPSVAPEPSALEQFYRRLLELRASSHLDAVIAECLQLLAQATNAQLGYLELYPNAGGTQRFWTRHGASGRSIDSLPARISRGLIAASLDKGRTINTAASVRSLTPIRRGSIRRSGAVVADAGNSMIWICPRRGWISQASSIRRSRIGQHLVSTNAVGALWSTCTTATAG